MGILSRRLGVQALSLEDPSQPLVPPSALFESLGLGRSDAGVLINERQAMRITTAQACVKIISEDLGTCSHEILQELPDGSFQRARNHRLWSILHDRPNPNMTAATFWGGFVSSMLGWGAGYAWIKRDGAARVISLIPLESGKTSPVKLRGELKFATTQTDTGAVAYIEPENVLHIMFLSFDGITSVSPIQACKNAFGLAMAAEKFGALLFGQGARASGVLSHPGQLEAEAYENLKKSVRERLSGDNALTPLILEEGMTWTQTTINPQEAQFLGLRQFQKVEIASLYRVAMHLLQDLQRATNNNIEHQSLDHVRHCLRPNAVKIEQEVNYKLLGGPFTMEHNLADMQRGDFVSQMLGLQIARNSGMYSVDDMLRKLRENPIGPEAGGDIRIVQGAMINLKALAMAAGTTDENAVTDAPDDSQPYDRIQPVYRVLVRDAVGRITNRTGTRDEAFAKRAIHPILVSMASAMSAQRFGNAELTRKELELIDSQSNRIAAGSAVWAREDAAGIAARVTGEIYEALSKEIL